MSKVQTLINLITDNRDEISVAIMQNFSKSKISHLISDKIYLSMYYRAVFKKRLNLRNPKTFNEKLQWMKLYHRDAEQNKLVDKYEVKNYIEEKLGEQYIIPTFGLWERFEDINFDYLPKQFVLKCTHDSGSVVICKDKEHFDYDAAEKKLNNGMNRNLYWHGREWVYKDVKPRIICEKFMTDSAETEELRDYKFFCFNGKVKCFKVDFDRFINHRANYYSPSGELLPFGEVICPPDYDKNLVLPDNLAQMIKMAECLSYGHPFLRVDFYDVNGHIYFGELTFFPASGLERFTSEEWDEKLGSWMSLPNKD